MDQGQILIIGFTLCSGILALLFGFSRIAVGLLTKGCPFCPNAIGTFSASINDSASFVHIAHQAVGSLRIIHQAQHQIATIQTDLGFARQ